MNTMTYKGYTARVEYDERDNYFRSAVFSASAASSAFHGQTVAELTGRVRARGQGLSGGLQAAGHPA
jgi:predicted HicB family RNase H-like nuclease